jgi:PfaB family protein
MEKIAIVGLSCLFPGAHTPEQFWQNLITGQDAITEASDRQMGVNPDLFYDAQPGKASSPGKYSCQRGGFIQEFQFDPAGYAVAPELLTGLDPLYQWSLYVARQALADSGDWEKPQALANCGLILGSLSIPTRSSRRVIAPIYQQTIDLAIQELLQQPTFRMKPLSTPRTTNGLSYLTSNGLSSVVAQGLGLSGINFTFDAACASSLFAIELASAYLRAGKADLMLAGAVSGGDPWIIHTAFSLFQAYPPDGVSRPLDRRSQGLLTGEGAGIVALKRYSDAVREGDRIYATILGVGLSNDGRGKHFFSPNPKGQLLAFERAYAAAGIAPQDIQYVECHATGTTLGDRTELDSMETFFSTQGATPKIGSVKSNVGHLLTAAGMPSLLKVILSLRQGLIPPTIHVQEPLTSAQNGISAQQVVTELTPWPGVSEIKRAAISAFGFGGTNSHLILEQSDQARAIAQPLPLSPTPVKLAIVGMDAHFGPCQTLDQFERWIHQGQQAFIPLPEQRWQGIDQLPPVLMEYGLTNPPIGAYIEDFEIDSLHFKIPPDETDQPSPQQLLMLKVADRAIRDAELDPGTQVAVIVAMSAEPSMHQWRGREDLTWQIPAGFEQTDLVLSQGTKTALIPQPLLPNLGEGEPQVFSLCPGLAEGNRGKGDTGCSDTFQAQIHELTTIAADSLCPPVKVNRALSYVSGNLAASRIAAHWDFSGPALTLSAAENSVFKALEVAQLLLSDLELEAVVIGAVDLAGGVESVLWRQAIAAMNTGTPTLGFDRHSNGWIVGEGAGAVVVKRLETAQQDRERIYAVIDQVSLLSASTDPITGDQFPPLPSAALVTQTCQKSWQQANIQPELIGYLEVCASGIDREDTAEMQGLTQAYGMVSDQLSCAIGSVKATIGHTGTASGMASLIKTTLCLHHQYLPATPQWTGPKQPEVWQASPFYVPEQSRLWFLPASADRRMAAINGLGGDRSYAHVLLSESPSSKDLRSSYLKQTPFYLFPLAAIDHVDLLTQLDGLQQLSAESSSLATAASQVFATYEQHIQAPYALAIVGHDPAEISQEIQRARDGILKAWEQGSEWKTPLGSYFTAKPQGQQGGVAFVYPGAFTSYVNLASDLSRLFPRVTEALNIFNTSEPLKQLMQQCSQRIYPRSLEKLSKRQLEKLEAQLQEDATTMLLFGTGAAVAFTMILRDYFHLKPQAALGYSLGEFSMMYALNVWTSADRLAEHLQTSPLFKTRLSGPKQAVREFWGLPQLPDSGAIADIWGTYVLLTDPARVMEALQPESRVYLTHINTPTEVVIAGDPPTCQRIIQQLQCDYFPAPSKHVLHCEVMRSEFDELVQWFTLPVQTTPQIDFYSAATYGCTPLDTQTVAQTIANTLCQPVDFPRLIHQVYADGTRIFIELGPGGTCSRWIRDTLKSADHTTIPFNQRGVEDHVSIVRTLAKLLSHRVPLDLSPLCAKHDSTTSPQLSSQKALATKITLGGASIYDQIVTPEKRQKFTARSPMTAPTIDRSPIQAGISNFSTSINSEGGRDAHPTIQSNSSEMNISPIPSTELPGLSTLVPSLTAHSQPAIPRLGMEPHLTFLQMRQEGLQQISQLIQLQMVAAQQEMESAEGRQESKTALIPQPLLPNLGEGESQILSQSPLPVPGSFPPPSPRPLFNEADLLEFAAGKIEPVFGQDFAAIDAYPQRVRLPMPPYLFVSRVTRMQAQRGCFQPCAIETEYDIPADAWYAVDGQVPAAIFVEASQGNILLISYLGVDEEIQGQRSFRALDGTITFVGELPRAGETFRTQVQIHSFTRGNGTLLYFYRCDYFVGDRQFLELEAGAGFFTEQDLKKAPGVTLTKPEQTARSQMQKQHFTPLLLCGKTSFDDLDLRHLSTGNLAACFGAAYDSQGRNPALRLPTSSFRLLDRILSVDPQGGAWGLGFLLAEKDLHPEQWYFNCHFKDDYCMPGTVIGEGSAQLLQFYLLYLGLQTCTTQARFHPILHLTQSSRSRGQVTPRMGKLIYQLEVSEIGLEPTPFLKGEATVQLDGKTIALIKNLGIQLLAEGRRE